MALEIVEFFGYGPRDPSEAAAEARAHTHCPFLGDTCIKRFHDGEPAGACTVRQASGGPIIACPIRLYGNDYRILADIAEKVFGTGFQLLPAEDAVKHPGADNVVAVFGKRWGGEVRLPTKGAKGSYFVDWILARLDEKGHLQDFVAVEVQSIDTTGNYRAQRDALLAGKDFSGLSPAGLNWENVNKRILPQVIYKGHVLRREPLCTKGLFFVVPTPVYQRIQTRLGGKLMSYGFQPGALSFAWYDIGDPVPDGQIRSLDPKGSFTTTVDQVALAFTSPGDLPDAGVYEEEIKSRLALAKKLP